jgi:hypothetical protein
MSRECVSLIHVLVYYMYFSIWPPSVTTICHQKVCNTNTCTTCTLVSDYHLPSENAKEQKCTGKIQRCTGMQISWNQTMANILYEWLLLNKSMISNQDWLENYSTCFMFIGKIKNWQFWMRLWSWSGNICEQPQSRPLRKNRSLTFMNFLWLLESYRFQFKRACYIYMQVSITSNGHIHVSSINNIQWTYTCKCQHGGIIETSMVSITSN